MKWNSTNNHWNHGLEYLYVLAGVSYLFMANLFVKLFLDTKINGILLLIIEIMG
jgi:hypothetical protein